MRHHHVLRDIKAIVRKVPEIWAQTNFGFSEYQDDTGRALPCYLLTRDGFTLLAMGYNSARAIAWKLQYIAAFNALEAALLERARASALAEGTSRAYKLSPRDKIQLRHVVRYRKMGLGMGSIAKLLDTHTRRVSCLVKIARALGRLPEQSHA